MRDWDRFHQMTIMSFPFLIGKVLTRFPYLIQPKDTEFVFPFLIGKVLTTGFVLFIKVKKLI